MKRALFLAVMAVVVLVGAGSALAAAVSYDNDIMLQTSLGQGNAHVSTGVVKFHCPIVGGPVAWIVGDTAPGFATSSVTVGQTNFDTGKVVVTLHTPNADFEFQKVLVRVRALCAVDE